MKPKLYLAGALHQAWQRQYLEALASALSPHYHVFLPHRDGGRYVDLVRAGKTLEGAAVLIWNADTDAIRSSNLLLAVAFGKHFHDPGVCVEVGYASAVDVPCYALGPDLDLSSSLNPMMRAPFHRIFNTWAELTPIANQVTKGQP